METQEKILCAAIWYKDQPTSVFKPGNISHGVVLCGYRHADIIQQHVCLTGKRQAEMGKHVQGFLTSHNRFLDRKQALEVALAAGQVLNVLAIRGQQLYSEDLY